MNEKQFIEYRKKIPIIDNCDILVIGGSQSGVSAAICAKRTNHNANILLIEQYGYLGGQSVGTMVVHYEFREYINNAGQRIAKGFGNELIERVVEKGHSDPLYKEYLEGIAPPFTDLPDNRVFGDIPLDLEDLKFTLQEMCEEEKIRIRLFSKLVDVISDKNINSGLIQPSGVVVAYGDGLGVINAKIILDCTANNDVAWYLGGEKYISTPKSKVMPMQTYAWLGGVDLEKFIDSVFDNPEYWYMKNPNNKEQMISYMKQGKTIQMRGGADYIDQADDKYEGIIEKYLETGAAPPIYFWLKTIQIQDFEIDRKKKYLGTFAIEGPVFSKEDQNDPIEVNKCMLAQLKAVHLMKYIHSVMPGWENCYVKRTSVRMGFRRTRVINGLYTLTKDDVLSHRKFEDVIGRNAGHDIGRGKPEMEFGYDIPYRILVPKEIDGLLIGARSPSCDVNDEALIALNAHRGICATIIIGQAIGVAAALCIKNEIQPRDIDIKELQSILKAQDVVLEAPPEGPQSFYKKKKK